MAPAETESPPAETPPPETVTDKLRAGLDRLNNQQKITLAVALAAVVSLILWGLIMSRQPEYKTLFSNLSEHDGGAIITALEQLNVPHKFERSGTISVPEDRVHEIRLRLASQGLPKGGSVGFELMENQKFGVSQFAEQVTYQRALEGELAKTIQSIGAVQSARVHLAIPKPSVFIRDEQKPTASVLLNLHPGRALEPAQVAGITHLIAASVPQMPLSSVSIVDQTGKLLSELKNKLTEAGLDPNQTKYIREVEGTVAQRIESILTPIVGAKNVRVQVAADIDFSQSEQTAETYRPNTTPTNTSIRSQQSSETANINQSGGMGAVPGALTNQPPVPAIAPLTAPLGLAGKAGAQPTAPQQTEPGQINAAGVNSQIPQLGVPPLSTRKDSTVNYEVDKTIRYTKLAVGSLRRISAAVVVNHRAATDPKTGKEITKPLSDEEIQQIKDLVKEAMGFTTDRGDTLSVANIPFTIDTSEVQNVPFWKDPESVDLIKSGLKYAGILALVSYLLFFVLKPIMNTVFPPPVKEGGIEGQHAKGQTEGTEEEQWEYITDEEGNTIRVRKATSSEGMLEDGEAGAEGEGDGSMSTETMKQKPKDNRWANYEAKVAAAQEVARSRPKAVADIITDWITRGSE